MYRVLVGKYEGNTPLLGWPVHRWEVNIKVYVKEITWEGLGLSGFSFQVP